MASKAVKAVMWEKYLSPGISLAKTEDSAPSSSTVKTAMSLDIDSQWELRERLLRAQRFMTMPQSSRADVVDFLNEIDPKTTMPSPELVISLMDVCLRFELRDKAVQFYVWGRDAGHLPTAGLLESLITSVRNDDEWETIRRYLSEDLQKYFPDFVALRKKISKLATNPATNFRTQIDLPKRKDELEYSFPTTSIDPAPVPLFNMSSLVHKRPSSPDWVNFVTNPNDSSLSEPSNPNPTALADLIQRDSQRQEKLKQYQGFLHGDRTRRLLAEIPKWKSERLLKDEITDSVLLSCIIGELIARNMVDQALARLEEEAQLGKYLMSTEPFLQLATHFKHIQSVEGVMGLLKLMMTTNVEPDIRLINILIELHVSQGNLEEACAIWSNIDSFNVKPSTTTISIMISLLVTAIQSHTLLPLSLSSILRYVHRHNIELTDSAYTPMLQYASLMRNPQFALNTFARLKSPGVTAYTLILGVYVTLRNYSKFMETYRSMEQKFGKFIGLQILTIALQACIQAQRPFSFLPILRHQILKYGYEPKMYELGSWIKSAIHHGHVALAFSLNQLRIDLCPNLNHVDEDYALIFLQGFFSYQLKPPIRSFKMLNDWRQRNKEKGLVEQAKRDLNSQQNTSNVAESTSKSPQDTRKKPLNQNGSEGGSEEGEKLKLLSPELALAFNQLTSHWWEHGAATLREMDHNESTKRRREAKRREMIANKEMQHHFRYGMKEMDYDGRLSRAEL